MSDQAKTYIPFYMANVPYTGNRIHEGVVFVYYFGSIIAHANPYGDIYWRDERFAIDFVYYLLQCPDRLSDITRN